MDDYIKREAAIEICEAEYQARLRMCDYCGDTVAWNIGSEIKALPAADVAPVVHCKDCRYWGDADGISTNVDGVRFARCRAHNHYVAGMHIGWCPAEDDFCSYGAREDGDSDGE